MPIFKNKQTTKPKRKKKQILLSEPGLEFNCDVNPRKGYGRKKQK